MQGTYDPTFTSDPDILSKAIAAWWLHEEAKQPFVIPFFQVKEQSSSSYPAPPPAAAVPDHKPSAVESAQELNLVMCHNQSKHYLTDLSRNQYSCANNHGCSDEGIWGGDITGAGREMHRV